MKILFAFIAFAFSQLALSQTVVTLPRDAVNTSTPIPIEIQLASEFSKNFQVSLKSGSSSVISIESKGALSVDKISTRFRGTDKTIQVTFKSGKLNGEDNKTLIADSYSMPPLDVSEEQVNVGSNQYVFTKGNKEYLSKLEQGNFRFMVKGAVSKNSFVKQVIVRLSKDNGDSTQLTINGTSLWWQPFIAINGDFNNAEIVSVTYNN